MIAVVVNDAAATPQGGIQVRWRPTQFNNQPNWSYSYHRLAARLPRELTAIEQDWLEVFGALYAIDRVSQRPDSWTRDIEVDIPVRQPDAWNAASGRIRDVWNRLTSDRLTMRFHSDPDPLPTIRADAEYPKGVTGAALFSGGLDSFAAVAQLESNGDLPALVTHLANPIVDKSVKALLARLPGVPRPAPLPVMAQNGRNSGLITDESQRARSLLYVASAALVARTYDVAPVWVGENGILAVHEPETEARVPSLSTRTAHPQVLAAVEALSVAILGAGVEISNPLEGLTKAGVVQLIASLGHGHAVEETVSCWKIQRTAEHCGYCIPCLQRFVATDTVGVADDVYATNPWANAIAGSPRADARDNLVHFIQLAQGIAGASTYAIEVQRPSLLGVGGALTDAERIGLHQLWASEVLNVASKYSASQALL